MMLMGDNFGADDWPVRGEVEFVGAVATSVASAVGLEEVTGSGVATMAILWYI